MVQNPIVTSLQDSGFTAIAESYVSTAVYVLLFCRVLQWFYFSKNNPDAQSTYVWFITTDVKDQGILRNK